MSEAHAHHAPPHQAGNSDVYVCPMHPEIQQATAGRCSECGMRLVPAKTQVGHHSPQQENGEMVSLWKQYQPLIVIIGVIALATVVLALRDLLEGTFRWPVAMTHFMAGFFLVFAGFKLLDLRGFAEGYSTYDLLARKVPSYGSVYPFVELLLGLSYLVQFHLPLTNAVTLIVMAFSGVGVALKVAKRERFQCVCLGTVFKVPLTTVTLVEDFGMALMALGGLLAR